MPLSLKTRFWKKLTISKLHRPNDGIGTRSASNTSTSSSHGSNKSVRFTDSCSSVYYTYGSTDYNRGSFDIDDFDMGNQLRMADSGLASTDKDYVDGEDDTSDCSDTMDDRTQQDMDWDEQVRRNTKVNMKRGYHSVAVLIQYRSNF